jgi:hypothetical protein
MCGSSSTKRLLAIVLISNQIESLNQLTSTDGAHCAFTRHSGAKHLASLENSILSLPDHGTNRSRAHVRNETREKFLGLQIFVVKLHVFLAWLGQLHGHQLVSLLLKSLDDFSNQSSLDAIGLDLMIKNRNQKVRDHRLSKN